MMDDHATTAPEPSPADWAEAFAAYHARFAPRFFRAEVRERSGRYLRGLLSPVERKNGWQVAEAIGDADPTGVQRLFYQAVWDADAVRDTYQQFVSETFGDPAAVLVLDETGFVKKGTKSVGVQRQYSGTAGKVENCQLGVFLAYVTDHGHVLLDRRLYLPAGWAADPARRAAAKVPEAVTFATIPALGRAMLEHVWAEGIPHAWVTADERYGSDPKFLAALEAHGTPYVIAVPASTPVWADGTMVVDAGHGVGILKAPTPQPQPVTAVVRGWDAATWQRLAVAAGAKGPRMYDWAARRVVASRDQWPGPTLWLLARRSCTDPTEVAYYLAAAPTDTPLLTLAQVAATRWPVEQCFEEAKGEAGLDHYEVRTWPSWHRHITLAMLAHGFLAWQRREAGGKRTRADSGRSRADGGAGAVERARTAPPARLHAAPPASLTGLSSRLVALEKAPPGHRQTRPLSPPLAPCQPSRPYVRL
jgi:SRSO17 transposase